MAIQPNDLQADTDSVGPSPKRIHPAPHGGALGVKFASVAVAADLPIGTPVSWNEDLDAYTAWDPNTGAGSSADEVQTLDEASGTVTDGTYTLTFDGQTTAAIDWDADEVAILAALEALSNIAPGDVVVADTAGVLPVTITFAQAYANSNVPLISVDSSALVGGTYGVTETTEGTAGTGAPAGDIDGFVYGHEVELSADGEVFGTVMFKGTIHRDDIELPTVGTPTESQLDAALRDGLIAKGLIIQGLAGIH